MHELIEKIEELKKKRDAVILVHNYQLPEVQDIGDYVGDSLELARFSKNTQSKVIVFCGVHFMAETAKIFNPDKKVLMPDIHAGCPMANMIDPIRLIKEKEKHPEAGVITYINSTAEVKALSDICCTSANGVKVAKKMEKDEIIFVPDKYLGSYVARRVPEKKFYLYNGYCPTHMLFSREEILRLKGEFPDALVLAHPECRIEVQEIADEICSTSQMLTFARNNPAKRFIICTEIGLIHRLKKENPEKEFIPGNPNAICPNMKLNTLEKILWSLEDMKYEINVDEEVRIKALKAIERMMAI
ncbi:MAG: quinolinate synthase NadA [candidate division WOR-3 bacterium]|nr:quinolinate synthase NadA [candidate division WOR-3 bacterium]